MNKLAQMFLFTLERVFGDGALIVEKTIMEGLYSQLCLKNKALKMRFENEARFIKNDQGRMRIVLVTLVAVIVIITGRFLWILNWKRKQKTH